MSDANIKPGTELKGWTSLIHGTETEETTPHLFAGALPKPLAETPPATHSQYTRSDASNRHVTEPRPPVTRGVYRPKS